MIGKELYHTPGGKAGYRSTSSSSFVSWGVVQLVFYHCTLLPASRPVWVALRSHARVASRSQGTNFETKIFNFRCFLALPTETSFSTPHYYPKYEVWAIEIFLWQDPINLYCVTSTVQHKLFKVVEVVKISSIRFKSCVSYYENSKSGYSSLKQIKFAKVHSPQMV